MLNILLVFGGRSTEHDVSCMSAKNVLSLVDKKKYHIEIVGITLKGCWKYVENQEDLLEDRWEESGVDLQFNMCCNEHAIILPNSKKIKFDVVFPILHGLFGEDGSIQGLFKILNIPFVGCGILASSIAMNKYYTKQIVGKLDDIRQADYMFFKKHSTKNMDDIIKKLMTDFNFLFLLNHVIRGHLLE